MSDVSGRLETVADFAPCALVHEPTSARPGQSLAKRVFDIHVALIALALLLPLLVVVVLGLLVMQGRPVFIRHGRIGRNGATFPCFKFRTMVPDAEHQLQQVLAQDVALQIEWERSRKLRRDPRVTPLGRVLRETSVDELPQLFNVLRGHMSLVGPRPIVAGELEAYGPRIMHYYAVRPGLTGAWQIGGRSDVAFSHRVELDTHYVLSRSFGTDLKILLKTIPAVLTRRGSC